MESAGTTCDQGTALIHTSQSSRANGRGAVSIIIYWAGHVQV